MTAFWTAKQLREALERCNADCADAIARHEPAERIEQKRRGIETLNNLLLNAERRERGGQQADAGTEA